MTLCLTTYQCSRLLLSPRQLDIPHAANRNDILPRMRVRLINKDGMITICTVAGDATNPDRFLWNDKRCYRWARLNQPADVPTYHEFDFKEATDMDKEIFQ